MGENRNDVCIAKMYWTSWRSVVKQPKAFNVAQVRKKVMQMQVNSTLCHIEFGMTAGRLRRFWRLTRKVKADITITARDRRTMFGTCRIVKVLDVIIAKTYESIAIHALAIKTPIQSMSIVNLFSRSCPAKDVGMAKSSHEDHSVQPTRKESSQSRSNRVQ